MMTLEFWMGAFIGTLIALGLILVIIGRANHISARAREIAEKANGRTLDLLEERNEIQRDQGVAFDRIAIAMKESSGIAKETLAVMKGLHSDDPDRIRSFGDLIVVAHLKQSVHIPGHPAWPRPQPAAFVLNRSAATVDMLIRNGLRVYRKEGA